MPKVFINNRHGIVDTIIELAKFKLQQPGHYDLTILTFSNYKRPTNWESLELMFSKIYPRFIFNSNITDKSEMINWVEEEHVIL